MVANTCRHAPTGQGEPQAASQRSLQGFNGARRRCRAAIVSAAVLIGLLKAIVPRAAQAAGDEFAGDPYKSHVWIDMRSEFLGRGAVLRYEPRVQVQGPAFAEDPMNVPISVKVDPSLGAVQKLVVLVDRNPIKRVLEYQPMQALPSVAGQG